MTGTKLYQHALNSADDNACSRQPMEKVWKGTPYMVDAFTSFTNSNRFKEIYRYCCEQFGDEASPIHNKSGNWHIDGTTVYGWTWIGFKTQEMLEQFMVAWPYPNTCALAGRGDT